MLIGYSLLWGEILEARELDYELTSDLQVVCPCCKESVVKVVRPLHGGGDTHYLRHRPIPDDPTAAERQRACDLRVQSLTQADVDRIRSEGRGQSLEAFLQVMDVRVRRILDLVTLHDPDGAAFRPSQWLDGCHANQRLLRFVRHSLATLHPSLRKLAHDLGHDIGNVGAIMRKVYRIDVSDGLVRDAIVFGDDLAAHLATPQARANRELAMAACAANFAMGAMRMKEMPPGGDPVEHVSSCGDVVEKLLWAFRDEHGLPQRLHELALSAWVLPLVANSPSSVVAREQRAIVRACFDVLRLKDRTTFDKFEELFEVQVAFRLLLSYQSLLSCLPFADHIHASRMRALTERDRAPVDRAADAPDGGDPAPALGMR